MGFLTVANFVLCDKGFFHFRCNKPGLYIHQRSWSSLVYVVYKLGFCQSRSLVQVITCTAELYKLGQYTFK